jgi:regulator of protease activity HflC (stomatin/prohibitin superfamily)
MRLFEGTTMFGVKLSAWVLVGVAIAVGSGYYRQRDVEREREAAMRQFDDSDASARQVRDEHWKRNQVYAGALACWGLMGVVLFASDVRRALKVGRAPMLLVAGLGALSLPGCYRPFEPIHLETIGTSEEGFLIPYSGDGKKQASTNNEEYLKQNLVYTKQVRIPQQWIAHGYETITPNGAWQDAAKLIKVDKSPVTREWTADPNSGTSNRNEAIWVMTSDQVEFSTGWTCTARIESRDDAVKFLHNYPAGSLKEVMDSEVRAKLQATFGLEVTDLPMDELRKKATPHIQKTVKDVTEFFKERGITITNLGITGGFVYKDKSILDTMVKVFNAEQEKSIAAASTAAQEEKNKQIRAEAEGRAEALLKQKKAEADGIQMIADAKAYEIGKAKEDLKTYLELKRLEIEKSKLEKWDGRFPTTFMGLGGGNPDLLLQVGTPAVAEAKP